ncbi:MAG TPA: hypothetical protein DDX39_05290 [Bacteroidales bacterium]|nr:MAG: hypothetical protein A2W98_10890 [Bacteroidetes bacterium GWF2_33_38]OFY73920.1 MAG: hypothetical protein A2265_08495 [Bacteroidetes bacterium RIFOXYA12_FULL_33_9]OFY89291.1 MAG: hypothetical protein A2236_14170 [Bacteroidetes bacterium RIFOXYA2_FULL_33_7]HBF88039.1 hypothetical protein [Bacteroidales bacterium]
MSFTSPDTFTYIVLPILIFFARILDVSVGTLRIIFVSKGKKYIAPLLGFIEVFVWILVIGQIMENADNIICYIAYAAGFATGNYVGMILEEKIALGNVIIRIITQKDASELIIAMNNQNYGVTSVEAIGSKGGVHILYTVIKRSAINDVVEIIQQLNPKAFYTIEDVRFVSEGIFPNNKPSWSILNPHRRKGK